MNIISIIVLALVGLVLTVTFFGVASAIYSSSTSSESFHQALAKRLNALRLSKMLNYLNIDQHKYIHTQSIVDIENNIKQCQNCQAHHECDDAFFDNTQNQDIDFCPNQADLLKIK